MRTTAFAHARGEYILFMDAADYADPDAVAIFVNAATRTGADILTCFVALFSGVREPNAESCLAYHPFLGDAILPGVFRNYFGSRSMFIRKSAFARIGRFREDSQRIVKTGILGPGGAQGISAGSGTEVGRMVSRPG